MNYNHLGEISADYLEHYGILGMKWGIRRYQNADSTLTAAGQKRYKNDTPEQIERSERRKAKVVKTAKRVAKVGVAAGTAALAVHALSRGSGAGAVTLGRKAISDLMDTNMLSNKSAASLITQYLGKNGERHLDLSSLNVLGNTRYIPGRNPKQQELLRTVYDYYFKNK